MLDPETLVRPALRNIPSYKTGVSPRLLEALASGKTVARLASNENLVGPSPRVSEALRVAGDVHHYPDSRNTALRRALGDQLDIVPERILVSTGSENVFESLLRAVLMPGDRVVALQPTFLLAPIMARAGASELAMLPYGDDLEFSADALAEEVSKGAKVLYISNPNNPTGNVFSPSELRRILDATPETTLVVMDEAYYEYAQAYPDFESSLSLLEGGDHAWVVLRTFSKAYGLAGLRVGYGLFYHPDLPALVSRGSTIFDVSTIAQAAALAALDDQAYMRESVGRTVEDKGRFLEALGARGLRVFPSFGNFVSLWFPTHGEALAFEAALAERLVFVKALPARGEEGLVRVTVGRPADMVMCLQAIDDVRA